MKREEQFYFKALKTGFVENKGQSGPLSADSKTQGKCQLSVKFSAICQLSVNPIQTLNCWVNVHVPVAIFLGTVDSHIVSIFLNYFKQVFIQVCHRKHLTYCGF